MADDAGSGNPEDAVMALLERLVPDLLTTLERLQFARRYMNSATLDELTPMAAAAAPVLDAHLLRIEATDWPAGLTGLHEALAQTTRHCARAARTLANADGSQRQAWRAFTSIPQALEALYPLAAVLPPVSRFFTEPARRQDPAVQRRLAMAQPGPETGLMQLGHAGSQADGRAVGSLYVPEYFDSAQTWPLIVALHGGSGSGASFIWSWVREARTRGLIVLCPDAGAAGWPLQDPDDDGTLLDGLVLAASKQWPIDQQRILLTGMSDGGTYSYLAGLGADRPFTHLAPIASSFHPLLLDGLSVTDQPICLVHGALDPVFPVDDARAAAAALQSAGARLQYLEIDDLAHTYPAEVNSAILDWFFQEPPRR